MILKTIPLDQSVVLTEEQKENVAEWIEALRSGVYKQTKGILCKKAYEDGAASYCCLGVACEMDESYEVIRNETTTVIYSYNHRDYKTAPNDGLFFSRYGFEYGRYVVKVHNVGITPYNHSLYQVNDLDGADFNQIADIIEAVVLTRKVVEIEIKINSNENQNNPD